MIDENLTLEEQEEQEDVILLKAADEAMEEYLANPVSYTLAEVEEELDIKE